MIIAKTIAETTTQLMSVRSQGQTIGFIPTMGALHPGHISLLDKSRKENDFTVCSIFVNPIQFNNPDDLEKYPRTEEHDLKMLSESGCNLVFMPTVSEMYPEQNTTLYHFGHLDKVMEGKFRPGHFNGVAVVVKRLLDIVQPHRSYFGEKDYQQLAIIKAMVKMLSIPVEIVPCPTMREPSGLAMSSRNERLSKEERNTAATLYRTLCQTKEKITLLNPEDCEKWAIQQIISEHGMNTEYFNLVDAETLLPVKDWKPGKKVIACVAAYISGVRLIDNMMVFS